MYVNLLKVFLFFSFLISFKTSIVMLIIAAKEHKPTSFTCSYRSKEREQEIAKFSVI